MSIALSSEELRLGFDNPFHQIPLLSIPSKNKNLIFFFFATTTGVVVYQQNEGSRVEGILEHEELRRSLRLGCRGDVPTVEDPILEISVSSVPADLPSSLLRIQDKSKSVLLPLMVCPVDSQQQGFGRKELHLSQLEPPPTKSFSDVGTV